MNTNMTRPGPLRWLARLTIPMMAGVALLCSTAIASANPGSTAIATAGLHKDAAYLAQLRAVGLTWPPSSDRALIGNAQMICDDLTWGETPQQIADDIHASFHKRGVTLLDDGTIVNAAHSVYCPGNVCADPACE